MSRSTGVWLAVLGLVATGVVGGVVYDDEEKKKCLSAGGMWNGILKGCGCSSGYTMSNGHCCPNGTTWDGSQCKAGGGGVNTLQQNCVSSGGSWNSSAGTCTCPQGYTLDSTGICQKNAAPTAPSPPATVNVTNVQVTGPNTAMVDVDWSGASGATSYEILVDGQEAQNGTRPAGTTSATIEITGNFSSGATQHTVGVAACN